MKARIVAIGKEDAWYYKREHLLGKVGKVTEKGSIGSGGFRACDFELDDPAFPHGNAKYEFIFWRVKVHWIRENEE